MKIFTNPGYQKCLPINTFSKFSTEKPRHKSTLADITRQNIQYKRVLENDTFEPGFGNNLKKGQFLDNDGFVYNYGATGMFRPDINWQNFGNFLTEHFKGENKVNTYVYGCSDGSEAYSMSILLQSRLDDDAKRFFPVFAKDINEGTIEENSLWQKNARTIYQAAYVKMQYALKLPVVQMLDYIKPTTKSFNDGVLSEKTKNPVQFSCANILEDLENIDREHPSIVMCRNMWPYVDPGEYEDFANALYEMLAPGSIVVVGALDCADINKNTANFPATLEKCGFKKAKVNINNMFDLVFEKE